MNPNFVDGANSRKDVQSSRKTSLEDKDIKLVVNNNNKLVGS